MKEHVPVHPVRWPRLRRRTHIVLSVDKKMTMGERWGRSRKDSGDKSATDAIPGDMLRRRGRAALMAAACPFRLCPPRHELLGRLPYPAGGSKPRTLHEERHCLRQRGRCGARARPFEHSAQALQPRSYVLGGPEQQPTRLASQEGEVHGGKGCA